MRANYTAIPKLQKLLFCPLCRLCGRSLAEGKSFCFSCRKSLVLQRTQAPASALLAYGHAATAATALLREPVHTETAALFLRLARHTEWLKSLRGQDLLVLAPQNKKHALSGLESAARLLAAELGIPFAARVLRKNPGRRQHDLRLCERMDAPCFVRCHAPGAVRGKRVIVLDDVWTTGTTLDMSAYVLREAGAAEVKRVALVRQVMPGFDRKGEETQKESDEVPVFLTHLFV